MRWAPWLAATFYVLAEAEQFDYVIVGGGTCGLTVANRLSELQNVTVAVIEIGEDQRKNPNVTNVNAFLAALGTSVDWQYKTVNQAGAQNRAVAYAAGKAIGGTSTINGMTYIRGQKAQLDAWETVGNKGWNWDTMFPYYKKAERYEPPTEAQLAAGGSYEPQYHGTSGHVSVAYPFQLLNGSFHSSVLGSWQAIGLPPNPDVNSGDVRGFTVWPYTAIREKSLRDDAATAWYWPVSGRPNLKLLHGLANKIVWGEGSDARACGVEYTDTSGKTRTLQVKKEVIFSAGAIRTPPLLEMSGVGNPEILSAHSIKTRVALPGVGENLIDQPEVVIGFGGNITYNGLAPYSTFATAADYFGAQKAADMAASVNASIPKWAEQVVKLGKNYTAQSSIEFLFKVQHDLIFNQAVPSTEIITTALASSLISGFVPLLPFARGSIHMGATSDMPDIDPKYFEFDFDLESTIAVGRMVQKFWQTPPVADLVVNYTLPGPSVLPFNATDAQWAAYIQEFCTANTHPLGTAAMLPKELGGVVDTELKVYGTSNVRVVDASVLPMQISGHLTSTLYAIAERASDIIKASM